MLKFCPLIFFKKFKIFILPLAGVRQYHKIIQKSRPDPQECLTHFLHSLTLSRLTLQASHFTLHAYELDRPNKRDKPNQPDRRDMSNVETRPLSHFLTV